jgi:predicted Fe-S protein YdhL (DUF1289 family)
MNPVATVASPCVKVCTLDPSGRVCMGCLRTAEEIAGWAAFSEARRARVIATLPERHRLVTGETTPLAPRRCSGCGLEFGCGAGGPEGACWCTRYPPVTPQAGAGCLCPACLAAAAN